MIAVIADDFTGAAEISGIGLRHGFNVEVETKVIPDSESEILIIATDTRAKNEKEAFSDVFNVTKKLIDIGMNWIFKKTDSVLRGHVLAELIAQMEASGKNKALLAPENPALGRTISDGIYYINDEPLHKTGFSKDPENTIKTSKVSELLGASNDVKITIVNRANQIPSKGIIIAEGVNKKDLDHWAAVLQNDTIPAGGAEFFKSFLQEQVDKRDIRTSKLSYDNLGRIKLYICGSAFPSSREVINDLRNNTAYVCDMPDQLFYDYNTAGLTDWVKNTLKTLNEHTKAIIAINQPVVRDTNIAEHLRRSTARLVEEIMDRIQIDELFIEGGATASSVLRRNNLIRFKPVNEIAQGVIRMKVEGKAHLYLTMKPGSYNWPETIWKFK